MSMPDVMERRLAWDACLNARDVGGYETGDGSRIRWRALLRADNLCRLTPAGQAALRDYGVRTIVDLRTPDELAAAPHPFAQPRSDGAMAYLSLPLVDAADPEQVEKLGAARTQAESYCLVVRECRAQMAVIMRAIAAAPDGGVLVHCHAGKDRTGLTVALLLALAGVPRETIAADYALSDTYLQPLYDEMLREIEDPEQREQLARQVITPPETMLAALAFLDEQYGGAEAYLCGAGVTPHEIERLRARLRE